MTGNQRLLVARLGKFCKLRQVGGDEKSLLSRLLAKLGKFKPVYASGRRWEILNIMVIGGNERQV